MTLFTYFQLPTLAEENFQAACARWEGGNYGTKRGIQYLGTQRHREVEEMLSRGEIQNREEFYEELSKRPQTWKIWVKHIMEPPSGWLPKVHGQFPYSTGNFLCKLFFTYKQSLTHEGGRIIDQNKYVHSCT